MKYLIAPTGRKIEDITGQTFNRLTVLEFTGKKDSDNRWLWKCRCNCDNNTIIYTSAHHLKSNNTKSCGCLQKEWAIKKNIERSLDITGQRKGTLTALKKIKSSQSGGNIWLIKCDCGNEFKMSIGEWNRDKYGDGHRARKTCPKCQEKSKGQMLIRQILDNNHIIYKEEWTNNGTVINPKTGGILRFDFYLPNYNCCIEYDGIQHFQANGGYFSKDFVEDVKFRDQIKDDYCIKNNIKIIRIPYTEYNKIFCEA